MDGEPAEEVVVRVRRVVEEAAAGPLGTGGAEVTVGRLADVYQGPSYDCPVVLLTPAMADAARVVVEVQDDESWWVTVADGAGYRAVRVGTDDGPYTSRHYGREGPATESRFAPY